MFNVMWLIHVTLLLTRHSSKGQSVMMYSKLTDKKNLKQVS